MFKILGDYYYLDLDEIENYVKIDNSTNQSGNSENQISVIKYEMVKMMTEILLTEGEENDDSLGFKSNLSLPFKISFNTLINKQLIKKY